jgi:hypothetical protein
LKEVRKNIFIPYNFSLVHHFLKDPKHAWKEASTPLEYMFPLGQFIRHDPKDLLAKNCDLISLTWSYTHER